MGAPNRSTCSPWATTDDACGACAEYDFDTFTLDQMLPVASDILFELSGRQFPGICSTVVYPCSRPSLSSFPDRSTTSILTPSCGCSGPDDCGCGGISVITLGAVPITDITEVRVPGAIVSPSAYRIDDYRFLTRIDGESWPCCSDLSDPANAFSVSFDYGVDPPPAGVRAAADLACQLALSCNPATLGQCKLPERVTSITRQGVSMVLLDPFDFLDAGRTGIYSVDLFLKTYNPGGNRRPPAVFSPDTIPKTRRVNT